MVKYLNFHKFFFFFGLKILFNVNGKVTMCDTPPLFCFVLFCPRISQTIKLHAMLLVSLESSE